MHNYRDNYNENLLFNVYNDLPDASETVDHHGTMLDINVLHAMLMSDSGCLLVLGAGLAITLLIMLLLIIKRRLFPTSIPDNYISGGGGGSGSIDHNGPGNYPFCFDNQGGRQQEAANYYYGNKAPFDSKCGFDSYVANINKSNSGGIKPTNNGKSTSSFNKDKSISCDGNISSKKKKRCNGSDDDQVVIDTALHIVSHRNSDSSSSSSGRDRSSNGSDDNSGVIREDRETTESEEKPSNGLNKVVVNSSQMGPGREFEGTRSREVIMSRWKNSFYRACRKTYNGSNDSNETKDNNSNVAKESTDVTVDLNDDDEPELLKSRTLRATNVQM